MSPHSNVFMSVGRVFRTEQDTLLRHIAVAAAESGLLLLRLASNESYYDSPLNVIRSMLASSHGAIIIAFPRSVHDSGVEFPESHSEKKLPPRHLTTVWNQIEAALALQYSLPILTLVEKRVHAEGLLSSRHSEYRTVPYCLEACQQGLSPDILSEIQEFAYRAHEFRTSVTTADEQQTLSPW